MKYIDDKCKKQIGWWNKNYFFAGTIIIVFINIYIFAFFNDWQVKAFLVDSFAQYHERIYLAPFFRGFFNSFSHANLQHVLLNMLCFFVAGLYLERKTGSLGLCLLIIASAFFSSIAMASISFSAHFTHGFSGVNYLLYSYIIIDYLFSFQKAKRDIINILFGAAVIALIYLAMCFNGGTSTIGFELYPYDLTHNAWHYSSFVAGIFVGFTIQIAQLKTRKDLCAESTAV